MGKFEEEEGATVSNSEERDPTSETNSCFCIQFSLRCLLPVVLGFYVLVFAVWLIFSRGGDGGNAFAPSSDSWKRKPFTLSLSLSLFQCCICFCDDEECAFRYLRNVDMT